MRSRSPFLLTAAVALAACTRSEPAAVVLAPPPPTASAPASAALSAAPAPLVKLLLKPGATKPPAPRGFGMSDLVHQLAVDDGHVFYTDSRSNLWSSPKDGSTPPIQVTDHAMTFFVDRTDVTYSSDRTLKRVAKTGGTPVTLVTEHEEPVSLVTDGTWIFYSLFDGSPVRKLPYAGGTSAPIHHGIKSGALAVDDRWLYVADYATSTVSRVAKTGGAESVIASVPRPVGLVVDEGFLYVSCEGDGSVRKIAKAGGPAVFLTRGAVNHDEPAVDASYVYWTSGGQDMALLRAAKDGTGKPEVVYPNLPSNPNQIALDEKRYFVTTSEGVLVIPR